MEWLWCGVVLVGCFVLLGVGGLGGGCFVEEGFAEGGDVGVAGFGAGDVVGGEGWWGGGGGVWMPEWDF